MAQQLSDDEISTPERGPATLRLMIVLAFAGAYAVLAPTSSAHMVAGLGAAFAGLLCGSAWIRGTHRAIVLLGLSVAGGVSVSAPLCSVPEDGPRGLVIVGTWILSAGLVSAAAYAIARGRAASQDGRNRLLLGSSLIHVALAATLFGSATLQLGGTSRPFASISAEWLYLGWLPLLCLATLFVARARPERGTLLGWTLVGVAVAPALLFGSITTNAGPVHAAATTLIGIVASGALAGVFSVPARR